MKDVIVIVGPTGVGKTKLSIELAKHFNTEIINGDSVQIYKELNIGSAKVSKEEMQGIRHHLLDFKNIEEDYTVYDYQTDLRSKIDEFNVKGLVPLVAGGTGLYLKAALYDYKFEKEDNNSFNKYEEYSNEELYELLKEKDEKEALKLHPNNRKRVVRVLNVINNIGASKTSLLESQKHEPIYNVKFIGLTLPRELLYERIDKRVDVMISNGLIEETKNLFKKYGDKDYKSLQAIGYKELFAHYRGEISYEEAIELIKKKSRNYAKRQYTWFNNQFDVKWFEVDLDNFDKTIKSVIDYLR
jgi:tRNA dimethylallyltransferase